MELEVMATKEYSTYLIIPELEPHQPMQFIVFHKTLVWGERCLTPLQGIQFVYLSPIEVLNSYLRVVRSPPLFIDVHSYGNGTS